MLRDDGGGVAMRRRRQPAVYSPGGCGCGLLLLPVIAVSIGVMFALAGLAAGWSLADAVLLGNAVASWVVSHRGGDCAPTRDELFLAHKDV